MDRATPPATRSSPLELGLPTVSIAGVLVQNLEPSLAAQVILDLATGRPGVAKGADVHLVNAYTISLCETDEIVRTVISSASMNLPDGKSLVLAARLLLRRRLSQIPGPELFEDVFDIGRSNDLRHFLLGSTPETLSRLRVALTLRYPGVRIVGTYSPPFESNNATTLADQDKAIKEVSPHVVWVGLGTPKQDLEARRLADELGVVAVAVGAAFNYSAGNLRRAPRWTRAVGLEWLFRLAMEPRRLFKRYLVGNSRFILAAIKYRLHG